MSFENRREREKHERREAILDAAESVFFGKGYERCSMDDIAKAAQLSRTLLYVYFKDKAAIMRAITLRAAEALLVRFTAAVAASDVGVQQICNIGYAYYHFSVEHADYFDALTQAAGFGHPADNDEVSWALMRCNAEKMRLMVDALRQGVADGSLSAERIDDPLKTAYYLRGALHGAIMQARLLAEVPVAGPSGEELVAYTIRMLEWSMKA